MKQIWIIFTIPLLLLFALQCDKKKKPNNPDLENPSYYYPINTGYEWTYVLLGAGCVASEDTPLVIIKALDRKPRIIEGISRTGYDWISSRAPGETSFVYQLGDTIFHKIDVADTLPRPYKVLVGPIKVGTSWTDAYGFQYRITLFEDIPSEIAGLTYRNCAKIKRTGGMWTNYTWWVPQKGKIKEADCDQSENCVQGKELKSLYAPPHEP